MYAGTPDVLFFDYSRPCNAPATEALPAKLRDNRGSQLPHLSVKLTYRTQSGK